MGKEVLMFGDIETGSNKFDRHKNSISLKEVDAEKLLAFNKISFCEKKLHIVGYLYKNHKDKPLYIMLPKTSAYVKSYE